MNTRITTLPKPAATKTRRRSILTPVAYSEALMPSLQLARSSRIARRIAVALLLMLMATICLMAFAPWQQTLTGAGYVIAYAPREYQIERARILDELHRHVILYLCAEANRL